MTCPSCWQEITIVVDLSTAEQDYIEDCFVCCAPMRIRYAADNGELAGLSIESLDA